MPSKESSNVLPVLFFLVVFVLFLGGFTYGIVRSVGKAEDKEQQRQEAKKLLAEVEQHQRKTPYLMGYDACKAGVGMSKNPYNFLHNRDHAEWQRGWVQCKEDAKKSK